MRRFAKLVLVCLALAVAVVAALGVAEAFPSLTGPQPWPEGPRGLVEAVAVGLTLVVGIVALIRLVLVVGLRASKRTLSAHELARLQSEARTDTLTRLPNRRAFDDDLAREIERRNRTGSVFCLMAADLDGLKDINDAHGHQAGDARLRATAACLEAVVAGHGTVYRTGGDEFMVLLPGSRNWHAIELAHRIHEATLSATGGRALSVGVTETRGTESRQELIRQADLALYEAKSEKLPAVPYQPRMDGGAGATPAGRSLKQTPLAAALARTLSARDVAGGGRPEAVASLAAAIGRRLGVGGRRLERLRIAALLHDVGTLAVPDAILGKPEPLAPAELEVLRSHVTVGHELLAAAGFIQEATWVLHHHEAYDGSGYPGRLYGENIPLEARIIAAADAYDALIRPRPFTAVVSPQDALAQLGARSGTTFDPACLHALAEVVAATAGGEPAVARGANAQAG